MTKTVNFPKVPLKLDIAEIARTRPRRTITIDWADYMDGPEPLVRPDPMQERYHQLIATGTSAVRVFMDEYGNMTMGPVELRENRQCICCGAPAGLVEHD